MGRAHERFPLLMPDWYAKKSKFMYKNKRADNTIIRKEIRQHKNHAIRQQISTYLIPINKDFSSIDTKFFTASPFIITLCMAVTNGYVKYGGIHPSVFKYMLK